MAVVRLLAALLAAFSVQCVAVPFTVQLGEARINLDAPAGFADTSPTGSPRLQEVAEGLTPGSNRILLFAISDGDLRRFNVGDQPEMRRYLLAATPRATERDRVSEGTFRQIALGEMRGLGKPPPDADFAKYLDSRPIGATSFLAELRNDPDVVALLQGTRIKEGGWFRPGEYLLSSTALMLVRGKVLTLSLYTRYEDPADLEWIRAATTRWVDDVKRLNAR
jgi:hypothetical protein